jgi:hypothetical protein
VTIDEDIDREQPPPPRRRRRKRSWGSRLAEFALWTAVAVATALIMISMSERLLPENF